MPLHVHSASPLAGVDFDAHAPFIRNNFKDTTMKRTLIAALVKKPLVTTLLAGLAAGVLSLTAAAADDPISADTFSCLNDMTAVRHFYVDNIAGKLDETVAVAANPEGGTYPEGSVVQLVPGRPWSSVRRVLARSPKTGSSSSSMSARRVPRFASAASPTW